MERFCCSHNEFEKAAALDMVGKVPLSLPSDQVGRLVDCFRLKANDLELVVKLKTNYLAKMLAADHTKNFAFSELFMGLQSPSISL